MEYCEFGRIVSIFIMVQIGVITYYTIHNRNYVRQKVDKDLNHLPYCKTNEYTNNQDGFIHVELNATIATKFPEFIARTIHKGGWWTPTHCKAQKKVAIIVPKRSRDVQLQMFLYHIHPFLQKKNMEYRIIVVEQLLGDDFNKASLLNIGYLHALNYSKFDCFVFHDIDYLPNNLINNYDCKQSPMSKGRCIRVRNKLLYRGVPRFFGGVFAANQSTFEAVNGMSNLFFGWKGEDDDIGRRFINNINNFKKLAGTNCRTDSYVINQHQHTRSSTKIKSKLLNCLKCNALSRMHKDGLNSLKYHLKEVVEHHLYTLIRVEVRQSDYQYPPCPKPCPKSLRGRRF